MTFYRKQPSAISNYFARLVEGIGPRGSSFSDIDACTHDADTGRFLLQEFKAAGEEPSNSGQAWMYAALAQIAGITVWSVRDLGNGWIEWRDCARGAAADVITEPEYRRRFAEWWSGRRQHGDEAALVTARDIRWQ